MSHYISPLVGRGGGAWDASVGEVAGPPDQVAVLHIAKVLYK